MKKAWSPYSVGTCIGLLSWASLYFFDHLLGVSSGFSYVVQQSKGSFLKILNPFSLIKKVAPIAFKELNVLDDVKGIAKQVPFINWHVALVVGIFLGAYIASRLFKDRASNETEQIWIQRFGNPGFLRDLCAFLGGVFVLVGARIAGGCTSGHGISGSLQLAVSGWLFFITIFVFGTISAYIIYGYK